MLFYSSNKVNKVVLLRHELYPVLLCLFKTALINRAKYNTVFVLCFYYK
jgi:hypothetical protein